MERRGRGVVTENAGSRYTMGLKSRLGCPVDPTGVTEKMVLCDFFRWALRGSGTPGFTWLPLISFLLVRSIAYAMG